MVYLVRMKLSAIFSNQSMIFGLCFVNPSADSKLREFILKTWECSLKVKALNFPSFGDYEMSQLSSILSFNWCLVYQLELMKGIFFTIVELVESFLILVTLSSIFWQ